VYRALQARTWPLGHVVIIKSSKHAGQGSDLPLPDLEAGVPPLELPAYQLPQSTHGWIRTTINAINNRALYRLSYMGMGLRIIYCSTVLLLHFSIAATPRWVMVGLEPTT
jgi:hypothetical protein